MRKTVYALCLLTAALAGKSALVIPGLILAKPLSSVPGAMPIVLFILGLVGSFIPLLVLCRLIISFKSRSFVVPEAFGGIAYFVAITGLFLSALVISGCAYLIFAKSSGISGVPLVLAIGFTGLLVSIPVIICEARDFYNLVPSKNA